MQNLWYEYSDKLVEKINNPQHVGFFSSVPKGLFFVEGKSGSVEDGNLVCLYWLVNSHDGIVVDARFQVFGVSSLIGIAEASCEMVIGKNYRYAMRIKTSLMEKFLQDTSEKFFPYPIVYQIDCGVQAIHNAAEHCIDHGTREYNLSHSKNNMPGGYPGWLELPLKDKIDVIEQVCDEHIRPFIAMDGGGIEIVKLDNMELTISYQGACATCYSAVGSTLSYIQHVINEYVYPEISVVPYFHEGELFKI